MKYKTDTLFIQTATDGNDELILVSQTLAPESYLVAEAGLISNRWDAIGTNTYRAIWRVPYGGAASIAEGQISKHENN